MSKDLNFGYWLVIGFFVIAVFLIFGLRTYVEAGFHKSIDKECKLLGFDYGIKRDSDCYCISDGLASKAVVTYNSRSVNIEAIESNSYINPHDI